MNFDELPEYLREKWWRAARDEYILTSLPKLKEYQLEALIWYLERTIEGWDDEPPQSVEEERLWRLEWYNLSHVKLELQRRRSDRSAKYLSEHESRFDLGLRPAHRKVILSE